MNQNVVVRKWGGTEIHELSMACVAQAAQKLLLQLMTATYGFQLEATLKATTMLNNAFRAAIGRRDSTQTVRSRLHDAQLHSRRPWQGPHLTTRHHAAWYRWAQKHAEWTRQNWHQVLFTDECRICLLPDNRRRRVWRQCGQAERLRHAVQLVQQDGGSLVFWGGIMWGRCTTLVVMEGAETAIPYRNDILRPILQPYRQNFERN